MHGDMAMESWDCPHAQDLLFPIDISSMLSSLYQQGDMGSILLPMMNYDTFSNRICLPPNLCRLLSFALSSLQACFDHRLQPSARITRYMANRPPHTLRHNGCAVLLYHPKVAMADSNTIDHLRAAPTAVAAAAATQAQRAVHVRIRISYYLWRPNCTSVPHSLRRLNIARDTLHCCCRTVSCRVQALKVAGSRHPN